MPKIYLAKRIVDYVGLGARGIPEGTLPLDETAQAVIALMQGMGSDGAKLLSVDANGNLVVGGSQVGGAIRSQIWDPNTQSGASVFGTADAFGTNPGVITDSMGLVFGGVNWDRAREVSSLNVGATSSLGAAMSAPPGQWSASSNPAVGTAASASRAAVGPGVRNVASGGIIVISATTALGAITTVTFNFRDGAAGAGAVLFAIQVTLPAAVIPVTVIPIPPLNIPGSTNTAMTLEGSANVGNLMESISLFGYNAP